MLVALVALGDAAGERTAHAAAASPVEGTGVAPIQKNEAAAARKSALSRARAAALDVALTGLEGPIDAGAKKAVRKSADAWTGAYRILEQHDDGAQVTVRVEVDVDLVRLSKRVVKKKEKSTKAPWSLGEIVAGDACGAAEAAWIREELTGLGAVAASGADPVTLELRCRELGPVRYTHMVAASVEATAMLPKGVLGEASVHGFGADGPEAIRSAAQQALQDLAVRMRARADGRLSIRVESPLPSARVRRFEQALRNSVLGVDEVDVVGIEPGVVVLGVQGDVSLRVLMQRIEGLSLPGFSLTIAGVSEPDVLTVRFY